MIDQDNLHSIRKSSRRSAIISAIGFGIVVVSIVYSTLSLNKLSQEKTTLHNEAIALQDSINQKMDSLRMLDTLLRNRTLDLIANEARLDEAKKEMKILSGWKEVLNRGLDSANVGNFRSAIDQYSQCITDFKLTDEETAKIRQFRGYAFYRIEEYEKARVDLKEAIKVGGTVESDALFTLVLVYVKNGNEEEAVKTAEKLKALDPSAFNLLRSSVPSSFRTNKKFVKLVKESAERAN